MASISDFESDLPWLLPDIDIDDKEDFKLTKDQESKRFGKATNDADVDRAITERVQEKTCRQTPWVIPVLQSWCGTRKEDDNLCSMDTGTIQYKLC